MNSPEPPLVFRTQKARDQPVPKMARPCSCWCQTKGCRASKKNIEPPLMNLISQGSPPEGVIKTRTHENRPPETSQSRPECFWVIKTDGYSNNTWSHVNNSRGGSDDWDSPLLTFFYLGFEQVAHLVKNKVITLWTLNISQGPNQGNQKGTSGRFTLGRVLECLAKLVVANLENRKWRSPLANLANRTSK